MKIQIVSTGSAEHYTWGGPKGTDCDGWHLIKASDLSIIQEHMPPGTSEVRHFHHRARQFFFVLEGELTIEIEGRNYVVRASEGVEILPGWRHQATNRGALPLCFLVTSQPPSHGDRVNV